MLAAWSFLTAFGGSRPPSPGVTRWFPVVGVLAGLLVGGTWWLAGLFLPPLAAAAVAVVADLAVTGMLHFDGVADVADGCLSTVAPERRLQIMKTPDVGAFGVVAVVATLLVRWSVLASVPASPLLVAGIWCLSRTLMATVPALVDYVGGGLATAFVDTPSGTATTAAGGVLASLALVLAGGPANAAGWSGAGWVGAGWFDGSSVSVAAAATGATLTIAAGCAGAAAVVLLARRRLGGYTGDVLGAAGVMAETAALMLAAARW